MVESLNEKMMLSMLGAVWYMRSISTSKDTIVYFCVRMPKIQLYAKTIFNPNTRAHHQ